MIENLASLSVVKAEMGVREVSECNEGDEEKEPWVVASALLFKRIVSDLITIRLIVHLRVLLKCHSTSVPREWMLVTTLNS